MSKKNKSWSLEDKLAILKENVVEGKSVADICEAKIMLKNEVIAELLEEYTKVC